MSSKKPGLTGEQGKPPNQDEQDRVDAALDEALEETFPDSDPINLDQWTEMRREQHEANPPQKADTAPTEEEIDRIKRYLSGPTSFSA
ncbi:hypothetical protein [Microvirga pudoricolor]|uniref:hypothetical protein n=1 Tax=Microvirga pudoricolor TaxID=2778729 RepID=UPI00194F26A0|nr:hypothetical protein [Microvirga pudoricolor]MBM6596620.1 hypothetical protein [Microvirga pudoricolor]